MAQRIPLYFFRDDTRGVPLKGSIRDLSTQLECAAGDIVLGAEAACGGTRNAAGSGGRRRRGIQVR